MTLDAWLPLDPRPGTNLKGDAAGAAWTYLMDEMHASRALVIGDPGDAAMRTIRRVAADAMTVAPDQLDEAARVEGPGSFDLVVLAAPLRSWTSHRARLRAAASLLREHGRLWIEARDSTWSMLLRDAGLAPGRAVWLAPQRGEARSFGPIDDPGIRQYFADERIVVDSLPRPLARIERRWPAVVNRRVGVLATPSGSPVDGSVPRYIVKAAAESGIDLRAHRFGLSARGRYSSRKVIGYCFPNGIDRPEMVVKMTRESVFNDRLDNEEQVLRMVEAERLVNPATAPLVRFSGLHAGLRLLGQAAIDGIPLTRRSDDARTMASAYGWVIELGATSARRGVAATLELRTAVESIVQGVVRAYAPDGVTAERLVAAADRVIALVDDVPSVLMHGDCATWNGWVRDDGRVAFLDWEAGGTGAPPMWDLFSLARSAIGSRAGWLRRSRPRPADVLAAMSSDAPFQAAVDDYRRRLDLPPEAVGPLHALCWAFRALREVPRLPAGHLAAGGYYRLLRASLEPEAMRVWNHPASAVRAAAL